MPSVLTITFNPCLDVHVNVPALIPERKLRCDTPQLQPGGGGINVARAIKRLGGDPTAMYLAAGNNGKTLTGMLEEEGVRSVVLNIEGNTRENLIVVDQSTGAQYRFVFPGPQANGFSLVELTRLIDLEGQIAIMVVSGSLPPGINPDIFNDLSGIANRKNIKLVVDTSGEALKKAVESGVYMIKPSMNELIELSDIRENEGNIDIESLAIRLLSHSNCQVIVVSMGAAGALLVTKDQIKKIPAPAVKTISTVGAGDSMVAGIVWKLSLGRDLEEAVAYGCACGAAASANPGTTLCRKQDVEELFTQMLSDNFLQREPGIPGDRSYTIL